MKGQFNVEFIAAILVFGILAVYTIYIVHNLHPTLSVQSDAEKIKSKAYQISDLLVGDPGMRSTDPSNTYWTRNDVKRVGLSLENESFVLNYSKIVELNETDYETIKNGFYPEYNLQILIQNASDVNPNNYLVSKNNISSVGQKINIVRISPALLADGTYEKIRIILSVWIV